MSNTKRPIDKVFDRFLMYLEEVGVQFSGNLLDVGSGNNSYGVLYAEKFGCNLTVLDIVDVSAMHKNHTAIQGNICDDIDVPDETYDVIVCHSAIEHFRDPEKALQEMNRLLKPGGYAFVTVRPLYYSPLGYHERDREPWEHLKKQLKEFEPDHPQYLNKLTWREFAEYTKELNWLCKDYTLTMCTDVPDESLKKEYDIGDLRTMEFFYLGQKPYEKTTKEA